MFWNLFLSSLLNLQIPGVLWHTKHPSIYGAIYNNLNNNKLLIIIFCETKVQGWSELKTVLLMANLHVLKMADLNRCG